MKFQSAPGITAGRSQWRRVWPTRFGRFNPRSASLPGDPTLMVTSAVGLGVSIRARHHCRAIPLSACGTLELHVVSIRARHHCRAILEYVKCSTRTFGVSIRARHHCRAIPPEWRRPGPACCFNPRPASLPGDPPRLLRIHAGLCCFNPRPASLPGDPPRQANQRRTTNVSIRARHHCRAIRERCDRQALLVWCFNPRPASLPGDP